jgi:Zn-dependent peptidase ImmA (M78 family)
VQAALRTFAIALDESDPEAAMRQACARLLERIGYQTGQPSMDDLLMAVEAKVTQSSMDESGRLLAEIDYYDIKVRASEPGTRQRFTVGHEIGHIILLETLVSHGDALPELLHSHTSRIVERLCDVAASELLLPMGDFKYQATAVPLTYERLMAIARSYGMSLDAILVRLTEILPATRVALLRRRQAYGKARPLDVRPLGRLSGMGLPDLISERAFDPRIISRAVAGNGRTAAKALTVKWPGCLLRELRALVLVTPKGRGSPSGGADSGQVIRARDADFILVLQRGDAPIELWERVAGRATRRSSSPVSRVGA